MSIDKVQVIKRDEVERRKEETRRHELAMLRLWINKYPSESEDFLRKARTTAKRCCNENANVVI